MKGDIREKYLLRNLILGVVAFGAALVLTRFVFKEWYFPGLSLLTVFFIAVSHFGFLLLVRMTKKHPDRVQNYYMAVRTMKFLLEVIVAILYCVILKTNVKSFLIVFCCFYIAWLVSDTMFFMKRLGDIVPKEEN